MTPGTVLADANDLERILPTTRFYPLRHMAPHPSRTATSWQNDGQNLVFDPYEGLWRTWALGNPTWDPQQGFPQTSWIEYAGPKLDQMVPTGVLLDRAASPTKTYWSGSCFVDWHNNLGRGYGTAWYYVSGPGGDWMQDIQLFTAPKLGTVPQSEGVVIANSAVPNTAIDGGRNFRDCRVFWDEAHNQLVLAATTGENFSFFGSSDGVNWQYHSSVAGPGPLVECPSLMQLPLHDAAGHPTGTSRWAIIGAVQGWFSGGTDSSECCTVWVGNWDGVSFVPDAGYPIPIDYGPDSYAATAGTDERGRPYFGYWLGNWGYCAGKMPYKGFQNVQGLPRRCWLQPDPAGVVRLYTAPLAHDTDAYSQRYIGTTQVIGTNGGYIFPADALPTGICGRVDIELIKVGGNPWPDTVTLHLREGTEDGVAYYTELTLNGDSGVVTLNRANSGESPLAAPYQWNKPYTLPASMGITSGDRITLSVLLDSCSVEAFVNGGLGSMAALIFPPDSCQSLSLTASGPVTAQAIIHHY